MEIGKVIGRTLGSIYTKERDNKYGDAFAKFPLPTVNELQTLIAVLKLKSRDEIFTFQTSQIFIDSRYPEDVAYIIKCSEGINPINNRLLTEHAYICVPAQDIKSLAISVQFE